MINGGAANKPLEDKLIAAILDHPANEIDKRLVHIIGRQRGADTIDVRDCGGEHREIPLSTKMQIAPVAEGLQPVGLRPMDAS